MDKLARALRRRPVRIVEAVLVLVSAAGVAVSPEVRESAATLAATLLPAVAGLIGGEAAQTRTSSRDYVENDLLDAETGGAPGERLEEPA